MFLLVLYVTSYLCTGTSPVSDRAVFPKTSFSEFSVYDRACLCAEVIGEFLVLLVMFA